MVMPLCLAVGDFYHKKLIYNYGVCNMAQWVTPLVSKSERDTFTPEKGEILFDETQNKLVIGDGTQRGGIDIANTVDAKKMSKRWALVLG